MGLMLSSEIGLQIRLGFPKSEFETAKSNYFGKWPTYIVSRFGMSGLKTVEWGFMIKNSQAGLKFPPAVMLLAPTLRQAPRLLAMQPNKLLVQAGTPSSGAAATVVPQPLAMVRL